jgi:hypothetical protein
MHEASMSIVATAHWLNRYDKRFKNSVTVSVPLFSTPTNSMS